MTTIAFRAGVLASDSIVTYSGLRHNSSISKISKNKRGDMAAACGDVSCMQEFLAMFKKGVSISGHFLGVEDFLGVVFRRNGTIIEYNVDGRVKYKANDFIAFGSGERLAIGAMAAGACPVEAVKIACQFDIRSGGEVQILKF